MPAGRLFVADRDAEGDGWSVTVSLPGPVQAQVNESTVGYRLVGHLALVNLGPMLAAVDLIERRVRWTRNLLADVVTPSGTSFNVEPDGSVVVQSGDGQPLARAGLVGPCGPVLFLQTPRSLTGLDAASGETLWTRGDVPANLSAFGDGDVLFLVEQGAGGVVREARAVRVADGLAVPVPDFRELHPKQVRTAGRFLLLGEDAEGGGRILRLYDVLTGKETWRRALPDGAVVLEAPDERLFGVVAPDGTVIVLDVAAGRELARLKVDPAHADGATGGVLLADAEHFYVGFQLPPAPGVEGSGAHFVPALPSAVVNGMFYAFDRAGGRRRWTNRLPNQVILTERFAELPLVLCSSEIARPGRGPADAGKMTITTCAIDKRTGKMVYHKEGERPPEPFHSLRVEPLSGAIELIAPTLKLRFVPQRR
jgi:hypothetical protein